jgi:hypothetical protein
MHSTIASNARRGARAGSSTMWAPHYGGGYPFAVSLGCGVPLMLRYLRGLAAFGDFGGSSETYSNAFSTQALARASSPSPSAFHTSGSPV